MITLKKDRELVRLESWSQLEEMAGFLSGLNPNEMELKEIIGRYTGEHGTVQCGLTNCRTPHSKGYIVVTTTGNITNIGNVCGKKYFGVNFETLSIQLNKDLDDQENREYISHFIFSDFNTIHNWIITTKKEISDLNRALTILKTGKNIPNAIKTKLNNMVKTQNHQLTIERELTDEEKKAQKYMEVNSSTKSSKNTSNFTTQVIANVIGIEALYLENDLKKLLVDELEMELNQIQLAKIDSLSSVKLKTLAKFIGTIPTQKKKIETAINFGKQFLTHKNLIMFEKILDSNDDKELWRNFLSSIS